MVKAICCGLDGAIVNSLDRRMMGCIVTAEAVMGRELYCMNYLRRIALDNLRAIFASAVV